MKCSSLWTIGSARRLSSLVVGCMMLWWSLPAWAQKAGGSLASKETEVTGGDLTLVSYVVLWVLVLAVVVVVFLRQKKLNAELVELERKLDAHLGVDPAEGNV